jgi:hypothetical protein
MFGDSDAQRHDVSPEDASGAHGEPVDESIDELVDEAPELVPAAPTPPVTGDEAVDEAMTRLAQAQTGSFAERIESGEHAHRSLQSRLGGLGGA